MRLRKNENGNMAEYLLPALLIGGVVLVGIAGLVMPTFESNSGKLFQGTKQLASDGSPSIQTRTMGKNPSLQTLTFQLPDGTSITLDDFPASMSALIETEGVNGATEKYLNAIRELADKLLAEGKITEAEANQIKALSNLGFDMADTIAMAEQAGQACGTNRTCFSDELTKPEERSMWCSSAFGASTYCPASAISWTSAADKQLMAQLMPEVGAYYDSIGANWWLGKDTKAFLTQYRAASGQLALAPEVKSILKYLSTGILRNTLYSNSSSTQIIQGLTPVTPQELYRQVDNRWGGADEQLRSQLTASLSGEICHVGAGETQGNSCH
jgi:hypothetical protein